MECVIQPDKAMGARSRVKWSLSRLGLLFQGASIRGRLVFEGGF